MAACGRVASDRRRCDDRGSPGVAGESGDEIVGSEGVDGGLEVPHHRQLRVREVAQHRLRSNGEAGHAACPVRQPGVSEVKLLGRVNTTFHARGRQELLGVAVDVELRRERVQQRGVHLELAGDLKVEVLLRGTLRVQRRRREQDRGGWLSAAALVVPRRKTTCQVQRVDAALLVYGLRFVVNRASARDRVGKRVFVSREELGEMPRPAGQDVEDRLRWRLGQIQGAFPLVAEEEQVVASRAVDKLVRPRFHCARNRLDPR